MKLSSNFSLDELTFSNTASRLNIDNTPSYEVIENLKILALGLEEVRAVLENNPINISSGFRCLTLNRKLNSKDSSQHVKGLAVDFTSRRFGSVAKVMETIANSDIQFDQLILEFDNWIHISFPVKGTKPRLQKLVINSKGVRHYDN